MWASFFFNVIEKKGLKKCYGNKSLYEFMDQLISLIFANLTSLFEYLSKSRVKTDELDFPLYFSTLLSLSWF